jgi:hypothetical protein
MSREIPYQPYPKPPAPSFDHMQSVLDKHAKRLEVGRTAEQDSDAPKTTGPDQQSPPGLVWSAPQKGLGYVFIDAGPYRITRQGKKYECHRDSYYLGQGNSADEAKQLCAAHAAAGA